MRLLQTPVIDPDSDSPQLVQQSFGIRCIDREVATRRVSKLDITMLFRKRTVGSFLICVLVLLVPAFFLFGLQTTLHPLLWLADRTIAPNRPVENATPLTTHVVLFKFRESATPFQIKDVS